jgi:SAM-dependent methyltransferase
MADPVLHDPRVDPGIPLPPAPLRLRVAGTEDAEWFDRSGRMSVDDLQRALASIGRSFDEFNDVLEWGCGCGRILRQLPSPSAPKRLYGNDIDRAALAWINDNLPWIETSHTDGMPPLSYADNSFDLVFNHSVMTHLNAAYQDAWLAELKRVLRPGGILTLTVHSWHAFSIFLDSIPMGSPKRESLPAEMRANGIVYITDDQWNGQFPDFYHSTFHDVEYIFDHWSKFLRIRSYMPRGGLAYQDMVVLEKPAADDADSPNSYHSWINLHPRHANPAVTDQNPDEIARLTADLEVARALVRERNGQLQLMYASRSWRLGKPWRYAGRQVKKLLKNTPAR